MSASRALATEKTSPRGVTLLRYQFDSPAQILRHFLLEDQRALLFFPDPTMSVAKGAPVILEIACRSTEQRTILRGNALAKERKSTNGTWLTFSATYFLEHWSLPEGTAGRRHRRIATNQLVRIRCGDRPAKIARLLDVGISGALLAGANGRVGDRLELAPFPRKQWIDGPAIARVAWTAGDEAGLEFRAGDGPSVRGAVKLWQAAREEWTRAREVHHAKACDCLHGLGRFIAVPNSLGVVHGRRNFDLWNGYLTAHDTRP